MLVKLGIKLVRFLLKRNLSLEESVVISQFLLSKIGGFPFTDVIEYDEEGILIVGGKKMTMETAKVLRESARQALRNKALELVREHTAFAAISFGVHKAETPAQMFFARAGLWLIAQEKKTLEDLAQINSDNNLE